MAEKNKTYLTIPAFLLFIVVGVAISVPVKKPRKCEKERKEALEMIKYGYVDVDVPKCDACGWYVPRFTCSWYACYCINKYGNRDYNSKYGKC